MTTQFCVFARKFACRSICCSRVLSTVLYSIFSIRSFCLCAYMLFTPPLPISLANKPHSDERLHRPDSSREARQRWEKVTRYITYLGLCIATCLTFKSSVWIASSIGLSVACYISFSEYYLSSPPQSQTPDIAALLEQFQ